MKMTKGEVVKKSKEVGKRDSTRAGKVKGTSKSKKALMKEMLLKDSDISKEVDVEVGGEGKDSDKESSVGMMTDIVGQKGVEAGTENAEEKSGDEFTDAAEKMTEIEGQKGGEAGTENAERNLGDEFADAAEKMIVVFEGHKGVEAGTENAEENLGDEFADAADKVGEEDVVESSDSADVSEGNENVTSEESEEDSNRESEEDYSSKKLENIRNKEVGVKTKKPRKQGESEDEDYVASVAEEVVELSDESDDDFQNSDKEELRRLRLKRKKSRQIPLRRSKRMKTEQKVAQDDSDKKVRELKKKIVQKVARTVSADSRSNTSMAFKATPRWLATLVKDLSNEQKAWVVKSGFGSLLKFNITGLPLRLGAHVINSVDITEMKIKVQSGEIEISEKVVAEILEIPRGKNEVRTTNKRCDRVDRWRSQFGEKAGHKITIKSVSEKALESAEADEMFKLNFLVVMMNSLVQCLGNPYVNQRIINFEGNLDKLKEYNWCGQVMESLTESVPVWQNDNKKIFSGPLTFLVVLYVDRLVCKGKRLVKRDRPAFVGWTEQILHERENIELKDNNFGRGSIATPLKKSKKVMELEDVERRVEVEEDSGEESYEVNLEEDAIKGVERAAKQYMHWKIMYEAKLSAAQVVNPEDGRLKQIQIMINKFLGVNLTVSTKDRDERGINVNPKAKDVAGNDDKVSEIADSTEMAAKALDELGNKDAEVDSTEKITHLEEKAGEELADEDVNQRTNEDVNATTNEATGQETNETIKSVNEESRGEDDKLPSQPSFELLTPTQKVVGKDSDNMENRGDNTVQSTPNFQLFTQTQKERTSGDENVDVMGIAKQYTTQLPKLGEEDNMDKDIDDIVDNAFTDEEETKKDRAGKRKVKIGEYDKSPYVDRVVDLSSKRTYDEMTIWEWVNNSTKDPMEIVFRWGEYRILSDEIETMQPGAHVSYNVIDVWAKLLNKKEDFRAKGKPLRLFVQPTVIHGTLHPSEGTPERRWETFDANMDILMRSVGNRMSDVGMVIFPVCTGSHWYVMSFNMRTPSCELIDNSKAGVDFMQRYEGRPICLISHFSKYLTKLNHPKANDIGRLVPQRIQMPWTTKENHDDCGIFAMRHMECYMGKGGKNFNTGFLKESGKQLGQLNRLRSLYCYDILGSSWNELKDVMIFTAAGFYNRQKERKKEIERKEKGLENKDGKKKEGKKKGDSAAKISRKKK